MGRLVVVVVVVMLWETERMMIGNYFNIPGGLTTTQLSISLNRQKTGHYPIYLQFFNSETTEKAAETCTRTNVTKFAISDPENLPSNSTAGQALFSFFGLQKFCSNIAKNGQKKRITLVGK
ncbi:hypothetical protein Tsp_04384 [Trichinella spiralis]|uniref:hypothetical protein n=1 Tax=Trichinella spiralis TaxID=6334 RepID=UPI0001EFC724|nr:hypothetical protein Tsp_04384 [Trichinella spiralis]